MGALRRLCAAALVAGPLLGGCLTKTPAEKPAIGWTAAAPGLESADLVLSGAIRLRSLRFDQAHFQLQLLSPAGGVHVPADLPPKAVAIWNGGYFEPDLRPSGLAIDQGRQSGAPNGGSGLLLMGDRFSLLRYRENERPNPRESALQLWPFLIEPGGADGIRRDDGKRARRSAIGLDGAGRGLLVGVTGDGITLFQLMTLLRELGAVVALNLDGGPSTGFAVRGAPDWREPSETIVANALVLIGH